MSLISGMEQLYMCSEIYPNRLSSSHACTALLSLRLKSPKIYIAVTWSPVYKCVRYTAVHCSLLSIAQIILILPIRSHQSITQELFQFASRDLRNPCGYPSKSFTEEACVLHIVCPNILHSVDLYTFLQYNIMRLYLDG